MASKHFMGLGAILAGCSVAAGAFGTHLLQEGLSIKTFAVFETAVRYQMDHALALLVSGWALSVFHVPLFKKAAWCFLWGVILFSGSLYMLALLSMRWVGPVTPVGGVLFVCGWGYLALGFFRQQGSLDSSSRS